MMNLKIGDKVLLYSLKECVVQNWFMQKNTISEVNFDVCEWEGFKKIKINNIVYPMFSKLGTLVTIQFLKKDYFKIENEVWCWPYKLIKNKNYEI